jgi:zinc protease
LVLVLPTSSLRAAEPDDARLALRTASALYDGIRTAELPNGLRVYLKPIPGSTAVTTLVAYKVGSADEDKTFTGLSHYLEHLMFKGTDKLKPGDIDRITFRAGGSNNAYTTTDFTAYHFTLPAGSWRPALMVEADRMRNLRVDLAHEFDKEKGAVIAELAMNEDSAWDLEYKAMLPLLFGKDHPYGHPVIGLAKHVKDADEKVITAHYNRWYHPNNASLIVVGGFDPDEALATIRKLFSDIPRGKLPPRKTVPEKGPTLPARFEMKSRFSVPRLLVGYPAVRIGDPDQPALNVLEAILGQGKRSRLYRSLVEGATVASSVSADFTPGRYPGYFALYVDLLPDKDRARVEKLLLAEVAKLRDKPVDESELKRVREQLLTSTIFARESTYGLANGIAQAVTTADLDFARKYLPRLLAVTAADVQRVARKYLDPQRSVALWSIPPAKRSTGALPSSQRTRAARAGKGEPGGFDLKKAQRVELPNGLVVVCFENHRLPLFEAQLALREGSLYQSDDKLGVASLTTSLLDEGTTKHTGAEISEAIESVGGVLSVTSGTVRVLSPHRKLGLGLLLECLSSPTFPADALARNKAQLLSQIEESETLPDTRARRAFRSAVYGKSPLGRPPSGTLKTVKGLTRDDCLSFHRKVFVPNNMILVLVGDFDTKDILAEVKRLTATWKKTELPRLELPPLQQPEKFTQKILSMPQASQLYVYLGELGIRRNDPDYYKLLVMDYILGTGPGFTDRLSGRLRDREGLAYTVSGSITSSAGLHPGLFTCYIGTAPENFARAKKLLIEELNRIRDTKPNAQELADAKTYLVGSRLLQFATSGGIAGQLLSIERYGLGFGYLDDFRKAVDAVTAEDVQAVARKHIHPERMTLVAAGPIDSSGKVVKEKE